MPSRLPVVLLASTSALLLFGCTDGKPGGGSGDTGSDDTSGDGGDGGGDGGTEAGALELVEISPDSGDRGTAFSCSATLADDAPSGLSVSLGWTVDGESWPELSNPLPAETVWRGAVLGCAATASDGGTVVGRLEAEPVTIGNAPPELSLTAGSEPAAGAPLFLDVAATDLDGDALVLTLEEGPDGAYLVDHGDGTGAVVWPVPLDGAPDARIEVAANDGIDLELATWTAAISAGDHLPELLSDCEATPLAIGEEFRCWLEVEDLDGDEITDIRLGSGPADAWVDGDTDELVWSPAPGDGGRYELVLEIEAGEAVAEVPVELVVPELTPVGSFEAAADELTEQTFGVGGPGLEAVTVQVPAGAFDEDTTIELWSLHGAPSARLDAPAIQLSASHELMGSLVVEVAYTEAWYQEGGLGDEEAYGLHQYDAERDAWRALADASVDTDSNTVRALIQELPDATEVTDDPERTAGPWLAAMTPAEKALTQSAALFVSDPARVGELDCSDLASWYGATRGVERFLHPALLPLDDELPWQPGSDNLLLVHGWGGDPRQLAASTFGHWARAAYPDVSDAAPCDGGASPQLLYYRYPSGHSIERNARRLRRKLDAYMRAHPEQFTPDVQFDVLGYGMGGVVGRSWLALHHPDLPTEPERVVDAQVLGVATVHAPHTGIDPRSALGGQVVHHHAVATGFRDFDLAMSDVWDIYECTSSPPGEDCAWGSPVDARAELQDRLDYWLYEHVPEHSEGDLRRSRAQLWEGWRELAIGMAWFPVGTTSYDRTDRLACVTGTLAADDDLVAGGLDLLDHYHGFDTAMLDEAVAESDLAVPRRSQAFEPYLAPTGASECAALSDLSPVAHGAVHALQLYDAGASDTLPAAATTDWCIGEGDLGVVLDDWLGHGEPACEGESALPGLAVSDRDDDGHELYVPGGMLDAAEPPDCDDWDATIHAGAEEACDGRDADCDGLFDDTLECHVDHDGDGYAVYGRDCDDTDASVHPGAPEDVCDDVDNDCNGVIDDGLGCYDDADGDGWTIIDGDCDDDDASVHPDAEESCNGADDDCDGAPGADEFDEDGDGWMECEGDCDEGDAGIHPGAEDVCDDVDSDCDGDLYDGGDDMDGDGVPDCLDDDVDGDGDDADSDCDDTDASRYHGATESCDSTDSDCDGSLVDGFDDWDGDGTPDCVDTDDDGDGDPDSSDCDDANDDIYTGAPESCDDTDSDCDGSYVDGFTDTDGDGTPNCTDSDDDGDGDPDSSDCDDTDDDIYTGAPEIVDDGIDQDCSGTDTVTCWDDDDGDGYGDPDDERTDADGDCDDSGQSGNDDDCDDTKSWIAPGLEMYKLVSVYSSSRKDHMITKLEPPSYTWGEEYADVTGSGLYDDASPKVIGYSVKTFPDHVGTPGSAWVKVRRSWSEVFEDHITHTASTAPSDSDHGHGCSGSSCPDYELDSIDLGWIRDEDLGSYTRHWGRWWRADRLNHRMSQDTDHEDDLIDRGFVDDGHSNWIFNENHSCP